MSFEKDKCVILNEKASILGSGNLNGKLYTLDKIAMNDRSLDADSAVREVPEEIWHQRYGHLNNKSLRMLQKRILLMG